MFESTGVQSFLLVFLSEMGDKTQLLSLALVTKFKRPWTILAGVLVATVLNHGLAAWAGGWISSLISPQVLTYILAFGFIVFAVWLLIPDKEESLSYSPVHGVFIATTLAFFIAEMGDKTQLATVALGAKFQEPVLVTLGSTAGMLMANGMAVFLGERLLQNIPMRRVHIIAAFLFVLTAIAILLGY